MDNLCSSVFGVWGNKLEIRLRQAGCHLLPNFWSIFWKWGRKDGSHGVLVIFLFVTLIGKMVLPPMAYAQQKDFRSQSKQTGKAVRSELWQKRKAGNLGLRDGPPELKKRNEHQPDFRRYM